MKRSAKHIAGTKLFNNFNATFVNLLRLQKVRRKTEALNPEGRVAQYVIENSNVTTVIELLKKLNFEVKSDILPMHIAFSKGKITVTVTRNEKVRYNVTISVKL